MTAFAANSLFASAHYSGERFSILTWVGLSVALAGLVVPVAPGVTAPDGVLFLSEQITVRLCMAASLTIGGIWVVLAQKTRQIPSHRSRAN